MQIYLLELQLFPLPPFIHSLHICVYIYTYTHMYMCIYIFLPEVLHLQKSDLRHPTSIYARQTQGTGHHRHYMAGLSLSAPVQSTSKQKDNTTCFHHSDSLQSPTCVPGWTPYSSHRTWSNLTPMFLSEVENVRAGRCRYPKGGLLHGEGCADPGGLPLVQTPSHQEMAIAGALSPRDTLVTGF